MTDQPTLEPEQRLDQLASAFAHWRQTRPPIREPIPQHLWDQAIALSEQIPIQRLSQRLRLSASDLRTRRRIQQGPAAPASEPTMTLIDVPLSTPSPLPPSAVVTVELERHDAHDYAYTTPNHRSWPHWCKAFSPPSPIDLNATAEPPARGGG